MKAGNLLPDLLIPRQCIPLARLLFAMSVCARTIMGQPALEVGLLPDQRILLAWPETSTGFALETAEALAPPIHWQSVTAAPVFSNGRFTVVFEATASTRFFRLKQASVALITVRETSPLAGESGVAVTRESIFRLSGPLATNASLKVSQLFAEADGRRVLSRTELASDRQTLTLFYLEDLPASARVRVTLVGDGLRDEAGLDLDADGNGTPGGTEQIEFNTLGTVPLAGTGVIGNVFAAELGSDGANVPLPGVTISVDGAEQTLRATTDTNGFFRLFPSPAGRFFVHIDGRTVTNLAAGIRWPDQAYYPFVGKAWEATAGRSNNLAGGTGVIFLPLIQADALKTVSATEETAVTVSPSVIATNPALAGVSITVPANALFADNGVRGGKVGIAPVPPSRLPGPLPDGLQLPLVITVQTDGPSNFDRPVPVCFPNLPDPVLGVPLPAGSQQALLSFNHDKGEWEVAGMMTVSADGKLICSNPGEGIRQPGWHGPAPVPAGPPPPKPKSCTEQILELAGAGGDPSSISPECDCNLDIAKSGECFDLALARLKTERELTRRDYLLENLGCHNSSGGDQLAYDICIGDVAAREWEAEQTAFTQFVREASMCRICYGQLFGDIQKKLTALNDCILLVRRDWLLAEDACAFTPAAEQPYCFYQAQSSASVDLDHCYQALTGLVNRPNRASSATVQNLTNPARRTMGNIRKAAPSDGAAKRFHELRDELLTVPLRNPPLTFDQRRAEVQRIFDELRQLTGGDLNGFVRELLEELAAETTGVDPVRVLEDGNAPAYGVRYAARIGRPSGEFILRGTTGPYGVYQIFVPRDGILFSVHFYDPQTRRSGQVIRDFPPGTRYALPRFTLFEADPEERDDDADGLADSAEFVLGTDANKRDTDGDGLTDGFEVERGTNPLDGLPVQAGIVAAASAAGTAVDICVGDGFAVVAGGAAGVTVFDTTDFLNPVRVAVVDTLGESKAVACSPKLTVVADGTNGLVIINLHPPANAAIRSQTPLGGDAEAVAVAEPFAFVGLDTGHIAMLRLEDGAVVDRLAVSQKPILDLLPAGDFLYVLVRDELHTLGFAGGVLQELSWTREPGLSSGGARRRRLAGGGDRLYASHAGGFSVFDLRQPDAPSLRRYFDSRQSAWQHAVPNGSGLAVVAAAPNPTSNPDIDLFDLSPDGTNSVYLTTLKTPGFAHAVALNRGLAYVADGTAGLQVVNYLAFDSRGQPPTVLLRASFPLSPAQADAQANVRLEAVVTDDVQVSHVEFYLDGARLTTDGNYPFEAHFVSPALTATKTNFTVRARAFDTGGNSAWSEEVSVKLVPDSAPPHVVRTLPMRGANRIEFVSVNFSEPVAAAALVAGTTFHVFSAGADGAPGTADDELVTGTTVELGGGGLLATLRFAAPLPDGWYHAEVAPGVTDLAGNPLAAAYAWDFLVGPHAFWMGGFNGDPRLAKNWSTGRIPGTNDAVVIDLPGDAPVSLNNTWKLKVRELLTFDPLTWNGSEVEVSGRWRADKSTTHSSGRIKVGELVLTGTDALHLQGEVILGGSSVTGSMQVVLAKLAGDLKLNGTLLMSSGQFDVVESATIDGGTIIFPNVGQQAGTIRLVSGTTLTISPTTTIRSGNGGINGQFSEGVEPAGVNFDGVMFAEGAGGVFSIRVNKLHLRGRGEAGSEARLVLNAAITGGGTVKAVAGGEVQLLGKLTPASLVTRKEGTGKITLSGTMDLSEQPLILDAETGSWDLYGGTLRGGRLELRDGIELALQGGAVLDNVTVKGMVRAASQTSRIRNGLTFEEGGIRLGNGGYIDIEGTQTITGGTIEFNGNPFTPSITVVADSTLTLAPGTLMRGGFGSVRGPGTLVNRGTIRADIQDRTLTIQTAGFVNEGQLEQANGGRLVAPGFPP